MDRQLLNSIIEWRKALEQLDEALTELLHNQGVPL